MALDETTQDHGERGPLVLEIDLPGAPQRMPLAPGRSFLIGRSRSANVVLDHDSVSRAHAELQVERHVTIRDLGSRNGTFVRGHKLQQEPVTVSVGDTIEIGSVALRIVHATAPRSGTHPPERRATGSGRELLDSPEGWYAATSPAMHHVFSSVARVASSDMSVLILGETGVGKEICAEQLHRRSARASRPLLRLNCSALPDNLIEAELFGYERGAFTGANAAKPGLLESTDGGTVFLDEIGELPPAAQIKLLRVLDRREVLRLGGVKSRTIDVRFVSATHRVLDDEVEAGRFRRDLLYRLAGVTITIPPLRERLDELPTLASRFVADAARRANRNAPTISSEAMDTLAKQPWPGNIRELRNVMERAVLMCGDDEIRAEHLALSTRLDDSSRSRPSRATADLREEVDALERRRIEDALAAAGGNRSEAARKLGISRGALLARLRAWSAK
jgi:DNA-binding NtrC family response regulator